MIKQGKKAIGYLPNGLPRQVFTSLTYTQSFTVSDTGVSTVAAYYQYRLNSLFDPDYSGVGHQPYMRDTLSTLYRYAVIYATKVELYVASNTSMSLPHGINIRATRSAAAPTDFDLERERPYGKSLVVSPAQDKGRLKLFIRHHQIFGIKKDTLEDDRYRISVGSNPTETVFLNIVQSPLPKTSTATETVEYSIRMKFYLKYYDRIDQVSS